MTCERIVELLTGLGLAISKCQVVRLVTTKLESFRAEDEAVLRAGLAGSPFVTVDDTGARHAGKTCFTTHIGSDRFTAFRTGPGKSRLAFLSRLLGGAARYVINAAAIAYMRGADLPRDVIDKLAGHASLVFPSHEQWMDHLRALGLADLRVTPDPVRAASEAALWGAIEAEGRRARQRSVMEHPKAGILALGSMRFAVNLNLSDERGALPSPVREKKGRGLVRARDSDEVGDDRVDILGVDRAL